MAECLALHRASMLEALLGPAAEAMGGKYRAGKVVKGRERKPTTLDRTDLAAVKRAKERDARILLNAPKIQGVQVQW